MSVEVRRVVGMYVPVVTQLVTHRLAFVYMSELCGIPSAVSIPDRGDSVTIDHVAVSHGHRSHRPPAVGPPNRDEGDGTQPPAWSRSSSISSGPQR